MTNNNIQVKHTGKQKQTSEKMMNNNSKSKNNWRTQTYEWENKLTNNNINMKRRIGEQKHMIENQ